MSEYMSGLRAKVGHDLLFVAASGTYVFDSERRVLLIRHSEGGRWSNPGGMVEPFETPADAAIRETWEETGLLVELTGFIGVFGGRDHHITYSSGDEMAYLACASVHLLKAAHAAGWSLLEMDEGLVDDAWLRKKPKWQTYPGLPISFSMVWRHR